MIQEQLPLTEQAAATPAQDNAVDAVDLQPHDLALAFPSMDPPSFDELVEDIRQRGVIHPVVVHEGQILDGLHRWKACRQLGVECPTTTYDGSDPVGFVVSVNLRRRHLTTSQRAVIAAELVATERGTNQHAQNCGPSVEQAAKLLDVSPRSVTTAKTILRDGTPEIKSAVKDGKIKLSAADKMIRERKGAEDRSVAPKPQPTRRRTPPPSTVQIDYGEQIAIQAISMVTQLRDDDKSALKGLHQIRDYINKRIVGVQDETQEPKVAEPAPPHYPITSTPPSRSASAQGKVAESESENLWQLKSTWKRTGKSDRTAFKAWALYMEEQKRQPYNPRERLILANGYEIATQAIVTIARIHKSDPTRLDALSEIIQHCEKLIEEGQP